MPQYQDPAVADALRYLRGRVDSLQSEVDVLRSNQGNPVLTRGDHENVPAPYEGQVMVNHATDQPYHYARGAWQPFGGSPHMIEAAVFSSSTDIDVSEGYNVLDFLTAWSYVDGPITIDGNDYFSMQVNDDDNIIIAKAGVYQVFAKYRGGTQTGNANTDREIQMYRIGGEFPLGIMDNWTGGSSHSARLAGRIDPAFTSEIDIRQNFSPWYGDWFILEDGQFADGNNGPTEFEVVVQKQENNSTPAADETTLIVEVLIVNHGLPWN